MRSVLCLFESLTVPFVGAGDCSEYRLKDELSRVLVETISKAVNSSQRGPHKGLARLVQRHIQHPWLKPTPPADQPGLQTLQTLLAENTGAIVLDSFCGTGMSTGLLAEQYPDALVIGIDQSAHRLKKAAALPANAVLIRAHCEVIWRELVARQQKLLAHYLLYPNPWPKPKHLSRRIHGHPAFSLLPQLGGIMELRSNWPVYVEEFGIALHLLGFTSCVASVPTGNTALTLFERKYRNSGHDLWRLNANFKEGV